MERAPSRAEPTDHGKAIPEDDDVKSVAISEKSAKSSTNRARIEAMKDEMAHKAAIARSEMAQQATLLKNAEEIIEKLVYYPDNAYLTFKNSEQVEVEN